MPGYGRAARLAATRTLKPIKPIKPMSLPDPAIIQPFGKPTGKPLPVRLPGSKSITNRALILAALADGQSTLDNVLFSRDSRIMLGALDKLGFAPGVNEGSRRVTITGQGGAIPAREATLDIGNAGTAARFLTAMLALQKGGTYTLDGDEAMRKRPMRGLLDTLAALGAEFTFHGERGFFPFTMKTCGLRGGQWSVDASQSSQILSALLMAAPYAKESVTLVREGQRISQPFVRMTLEMMRQFGLSIDGTEEDAAFTLPRNLYQPRHYMVEPDYSAASYFWTLPLVTGQAVSIGDDPAGTPLQGDYAYRDVLVRLQAGERDFDFNAISDTFLTLAAAAPLVDGTLRIKDIGHTRFQECDRVLAMATELEKLGQQVRPTVTEMRKDTALDFLEIDGSREALKTAVAQNGERVEGCDYPLIRIDTYHDHRVAMSFGILGSYDLFGDGRPWLAINDPACCSKTFPDFFEQLGTLQSLTES